MYDRILMAVDHSDIAERVINAARELASLSNGEVWVLHLREMETMPRAGVVPIESGAEAQSIVGHAAKELHDAGVKAHYEVRDAIYGQAGRDIVDAAHAHDAGIIVMGSRGHSGMTGLVLGSTAHKVIHLSDRPVLVVR
jgi:nucleotide-binding universal stress UspA family protein